MKIVEMNSRMRKLYSPDWDLGSVTLPEDLRYVIERGIVVHEGCFVFRQRLENSPHLSVDHSRTDYEDIINHLHMIDFTDRDYLLTGFAAMQRISDILREQFPDETFYGTISANLDGPNVSDCVVRFHCLHKGEEHLVIGNLEESKLEAVCLIKL